MTITKQQYISALQSPGVLNKRRIAILKVLYESMSYKASPQEIGKKIGHSFQTINLRFGSLAKAICEHLNIELESEEFNSSEWWPAIATGNREQNGFNWKLKKNFIDALHELGVLSEEHTYPEEANLPEGSVKRILVNAYERNALAREKCIEHYGAVCKVCNINFETIYGEIGKDFIHVHHIKMVSLSGGVKCNIDPILDLRPVCPNCHAMIHRKEVPYTIEELRKLIKFKFP